MIRMLSCLAVLCTGLLLHGCGGANDSEVAPVTNPGAGLPEEQKRNYAEESRSRMPNMKYKPKPPKEEKK